MSTIGRSVLLRTLPTLVALLLAFFTPWGPAGGHRGVLGPPAAAGPVTASFAIPEHVGRTAAGWPARTGADVAAEPLTAPTASADATHRPAAGPARPAPCLVPDHVRALIAQHAAGPAGSRAPPFAA